jgi:hypothetical protein
LTASLVFHMNAKKSRIDHNSVIALIQLIQARNLRKDAISLDPNHTDPAWRDEEETFFRGINTALMDFYAQKTP